MAESNPKDLIQALLSDPETMKEIIDGAFAESDKDGSGYIDKSELKAVLEDIAKEKGFQAPSEEEINKKYSALDVNKDGKISKEEFAVLVKEVLEFIIGTL